MMITRLVLLLLVVAFCGGMDPILDFGNCLKVIPVTHRYINYNEGVWFPQYRTRDSNFSCHTLYENVFVDGEVKLEQQSFYTENGVVNKDPLITYFEVTKNRGIFNSIDYIPELGSVTIYTFILGLTPDYRVRYSCITHPKADNFVNVIIETRQMNPTLETIEDALEAIRRAGLGVRLARIQQEGCRRPISHQGYRPIDEGTSTS